MGIAAHGSGNVEIRDNTIRGMQSPHITGIIVSGGGRFRIHGNVLVNDWQEDQARALFCDTTARYADNVISGFDPVATDCVDAGDNDISP